MSWKKNFVVIFGTFTLGLTGMSILAPPTPDSNEQKKLQDASDAQQKANDDMHDKAGAEEDAHQAAKNIPGEHKPPVKPRGPRFRIRIP